MTGTKSAGEIVYSAEATPADSTTNPITLVMDNQMDGVVRITKYQATINSSTGEYSEALEGTALSSPAARAPYTGLPARRPITTSI